jgi:hypothetical protein
LAFSRGHISKKGPPDRRSLHFAALRQGGCNVFA